MATITLNGKLRELDGATTVTGLLEALNVNPKQVAVALNGEVVRRIEWADTTIHEGDAVEIVRAVGGGSR
jgi:sulfur carrier protein